MTALLNRAYREYHELGYVTDTTRKDLEAAGITAEQLERYLAL